MAEESIKEQENYFDDLESAFFEVSPSPESPEILEPIKEGDEDGQEEEENKNEKECDNEIESDNVFEPILLENENVPSSSDSAATATATSSTNLTPKKELFSPNSILINPRQRGNPVLKYITNTRWEYSDILPDYVMNKRTCGIFLSLRYHNLHPDYIHQRLTEINNCSYQLKIMLISVDVPDPFPVIKNLTLIGMLTDVTLMLGYSSEELGKIIENYKILENKPPESIQEKKESTVIQQVIDALTTVRTVNKTDAMTLLNNFGTLENIINANADDIGKCPGFGPHKAEKLYTALNENFKK